MVDPTKFEKSRTETDATRLERRPQFFYVLGALLGDGCTYLWRNQHQVWLVGNKEFATRYAERAASCLGTRVVAYYYRRRDYWFVKVNHQELFSIVKHVRQDKSYLMALIKGRSPTANSLGFVQGFFDAEGCLKVINDNARNIAKICLDITNTDLSLQQVTQTVMKENLGIEARMSCQRDPRPNRQLVYHLRIYKKSDVRKFLTLIPTIKMTEKKAGIASRWLEKERWGRGSNRSIAC